MSPCPSGWKVSWWHIFFNNLCRQSRSHIPGSTLCRNPLPGSTHSQDSGGGSVQQTSWCCTGKKLWSGQSGSLQIPCPELPYIWSLKGKKQWSKVRKMQGNLRCIFSFLIWKTKNFVLMFTQNLTKDDSKGLIGLYHWYVHFHSKNSSNQGYKDLILGA